MKTATESSVGCRQVEGKTPAKTSQQKARENRIFEIEKSYRPGPLADKKPVTDALRFLVTKKDALRIAHGLVQKAKAGSVEAFREITDRLEGKVQQTVEVSGQINLGVLLNKARARVGKPPLSLPDGTTVDAEIVKPEPDKPQE